MILVSTVLHINQLSAINFARQYTSSRQTYIDVYSIGVHSIEVHSIGKTTDVEIPEADGTK